MVSIETFYAAAANAGLLINASIDGQIVAVDFRAPDETVLDGLALSTEYTMHYPRSTLPHLASNHQVVIEQVTYRMREVRALGYGTECRATVTRL